MSGMIVIFNYCILHSPSRTASRISAFGCTEALWKGSQPLLSVSANALLFPFIAHNVAKSPGADKQHFKELFVLCILYICCLILNILFFSWALLWISDVQLNIIHIGLHTVHIYQGQILPGSMSTKPKITYTLNENTL